MKNFHVRLIVLLFAVLLPLCVAAEEAGTKTIVYFQDGSYVLVPDSIAMDSDALAAYCAAYFPGRAYTLDPDAETIRYDAVIAESYVTQLYGAESRAMSVRIVKLGLYETIVCTTQAEEMTIPSRYLIIRDLADMEHHIATVHAPRTGEASFRETASGNGKVIAQAKTGSVVAVLEYTGASYTKILYDGEEGYIRTDCLVFHSGDEILGRGTLHVKGVTDGKKSVTIRATASSSAAKVADLATGTVVIVHAKEDKWYAIEADGWYGYVQQQYLELNAQ